MNEVGSYKCEVSTGTFTTFDIGVIAIKKCPPQDVTCGDLR